MNLEEMFLQMAAGDLVVPREDEDMDEPEQVAQVSASDRRLGRASQAAAPKSIGEFVESVGETLGGLSDIPAAAVKGAAQGFAGLPGDIEGIGRLLLGAMGVNVEESTALPTTEEIKKFLDERLGKVGTGDNPYETVGEFMAPGGYTKAVKASAQGAKKVAGAVKETLATPPRGSVQLAPNLEVEIAPAERTKNFKNWFGGSKIVDDKGKPRVMYHGTAADFDEFGNSPRGAIFVTDDPSFADDFAGTQETIEKGFNPNVMPLYVKAENPFDYENPKHIDAVMNRVVIQKRPKGWGDIDKQNLRDNLELGKWGFIEDRDVQKAIKDLGFDSFYVKEHGVKNLGVFDPKQLKSATGNKGTFDPKDPRITRGAIGAPVAPAAMQDEENK
jgi:hypothetical protein